MATHNEENTARLAKNWLLGAGLVTIFFVGFLVWSDCYLTHSKREENTKTVLGEIRTAQTSLSSMVTDNRMHPRTSDNAKSE